MGKVKLVSLILILRYAELYMQTFQPQHGAPIILEQIWEVILTEIIYMLPFLPSRCILKLTKEYVESAHMIISNSMKQ